MSTIEAVLAWIGLALGAGALVIVLVLLDRVLTPVMEIRRYANDILAAGVGIAKNLDGVDQAARTRDLATAVPELAAAYLHKLGATP
jgi:hypothetical protein